MKSVRLTIITLWLLAVAFGAVLVTAPTASALQSGSGRLVGTEWALVSFGSPGLETPVIAANPITLEFPAPNQVAGMAGCNSYSGSYGVERADIVFNDIISTLRVCENDSVMQQEEGYLAALRSASSYALVEETLTIWYANDEQRLNFLLTSTEQELDPLEESEWQLTAYGPPFAPSAVIGESPVTLAFLDNNRVEGNGGCNGFSADYQVNGNAIVFSRVFPTENACADPTMAEQEQTFFTALRGAMRFAQTSQRLTIVYNGVFQLYFTPIPRDLASQPPLPDGCEATWTVESGETLSGIATACNTTVAALLIANPFILNPAQIFAGQQLIIPRGSAVVAPTMPEGKLFVEQLSVAPGTSVNLLGSEFAPDVDLDIGFGPIDSEYEIIGAAHTMPDGTFRVTITVPAYASSDIQWVFVAVGPDGATAISDVFNIDSGE